MSIFCGRRVFSSFNKVFALEVVGVGAIATTTSPSYGLTIGCLRVVNFFAWRLFWLVVNFGTNQELHWVARQVGSSCAWLNFEGALMLLT